MTNARAHLKIYGLVQGVFFRASTRDAALRLGLGGWVRNSPDGSVEAVFEGDEETVARAVKWCEEGPTGSRVDEVDVQWGGYTGEFEGFKVRYF